MSLPLMKTPRPPPIPVQDERLPPALRGCYYGATEAYSADNAVLPDEDARKRARWVERIAMPRKYQSTATTDTTSWRNGACNCP